MNPDMQIYVARCGSDQNPGSKHAPFLTLQRAKAEIKKRPPGASVTVHVAKGEYFLSDPLCLTEAESNTRWCSDGAVLTAAMPIPSPTIYCYDQNIYYLQLDPKMPIDAFYIDKNRQIMARYPNFDETAPLQGSASMAEIKIRSQSYRDPKGGYVRALHDRLWGGNSFLITGKDENAPHGLSLQWIGDNNRGSGIWALDHAMLVENVFEELDAEREWYYDPNDGRLYFIPDAGIDLTSASFAVSVSDSLLTVRGKQDLTPAKNICFEGFTFARTSRTMFTGRYVPLLRGDWCIVKQGAITISDTEDIEIRGCTLQDIGGNAIVLDGYNRGTVIEDNEMLDIGSSGIMLAGKPDSCREPSFWDVTPTPDTEEWYLHKTDITDTTPGPIRAHYPKDILIRNNHIQNIGIFEKQSSHIAVSVSHRVKILHNTLHTGPRAGININDGTFGGHEIAYNDVFDVQKETDDHGMFNAWGRDRFWSLGGFDTIGLNGEIKRPYAFLDAMDQTEIHHNRMHFSSRLDGGATFGIDLDDGSSNYAIHHNLCLNMGIKLREGFGRTVYNNLIIDAAIQLHCPYAKAQDKITRNLICSNPPYILALADETRLLPSEDDIDCNIFAAMQGEVNLPECWEICGFDRHSISFAPQFADPTVNDYTVKNLDALKEIGFEDIGGISYGKPGCLHQAPAAVFASDGQYDVMQLEWKEMTFSDVTPSLMSATGAGIAMGTCILKLPGKVSTDGLREMDVIQAVNGQKVADTQAFLEIMKQITGQAEFLILRNQIRLIVKDSL